MRYKLKKDLSSSSKKRRRSGFCHLRLGQDNTDFVASAAESLSTAFDRFEGVLAQAS